jgi:hypothetical protein
MLGLAWTDVFFGRSNGIGGHVGGSLNVSARAGQPEAGLGDGEGVCRKC